MSTSRRKGNRNVNRCIEDFYSSSEYLVAKVEKGGKFTAEKDLYGVADILVLNRNYNCVEFVQVTSNKPHPHQKFQDFVDIWDIDGIVLCQYVWHDRKGWVYYRYKPNKNRIRIDMRKQK